MKAYSVIMPYTVEKEVIYRHFIRPKEWPLPYSLIDYIKPFVPSDADIDIKSCIIIKCGFKIPKATLDMIDSNISLWLTDITYANHRENLSLNQAAEFISRYRLPTIKVLNYPEHYAEVTELLQTMYDEVTNDFNKGIANSKIGDLIIIKRIIDYYHMNMKSNGNDLVRQISRPVYYGLSEKAEAWLLGVWS